MRRPALRALGRACAAEWAACPGSAVAPVPLKATVRTASGGRVLIEWTDPSGTLNPDPAYPLNVWLSVGAWDKAKLASGHVPVKSV